MYEQRHKGCEFDRDQGVCMGRVKGEKVKVEMMKLYSNFKK